ncbi:MAG: energy-coupling factor transporter ATPase [Candidatus Atribacteria bacterium]|nr:energy-coupling factor transporter ATPase [Candidatus Atribacteria bacterium]MCD6349176.1 energy-coupling factor transporter ATPase [Candidatus Atribacteria bacterium]
MFIRLEQVYFTYFPGTPFETKALRGVNLVIDKGESVGIVGRTGCGKSTLVQHFNALLLPQQGEVWVDGINTKAKGINLKNIRKKVGLVFQYPEHQMFEETVFNEVAFGPRNMGITGEALEETVRWAIAVVGLDYEEIKDRTPFELSGGQMRRVAIASVLSMRPEVLVLDEPTAGLDPQGKRSILLKLKELRKKEGLTLVLVSHSMEDLVIVCERILVMHDGQIAIDGATREVFTQFSLEEYGIKPPVTVQTAFMLRQKGFDIEPSLLTPRELADAILKKILEKKDVW